MANKAKHAFGSSQGIEAALQAGVINERDILFLDEETDNPKVGWVNKNGEAVIINSNNADISGLEAEIAKKADVEEVETKIEAVKTYTDGKVEAAVEAAMSEHLVKRYKVENVPAGTLVDYFDKEIRIMCPVNSEFVKQAVGAGGDANTYYMTFKTYAPDDNVVGYIEHLNDKTDSEVLTDLKTDEYGRKYQPTWLALAKYDDVNGWTYYGANSSKERYIGWDYQIDWYDATGTIVKSDSVRINLSNEECHNTIEPYYMSNAVKLAKEYTDLQIEEAVNGAIEIIEF